MRHISLGPVPSSGQVIESHRASLVLASEVTQTQKSSSAGRASSHRVVKLGDDVGVLAGSH